MAAKKAASTKAATTAPKKQKTKKAPGAPATRGKRKPAPAGSAGLAPDAVSALSDADADALAALVEKDGGQVLARYKDPLFGRPVVFAVLPVAKVERTIFQRDVSEAHVDKLVDAMKRTGAYLDPIICVRDPAGGDDGLYRSPNGGHRLTALKRMGAQSVTALVIPDVKLAFKILALNTEKAHALKEKALETIRMLRALAAFGGKEDEFQGELEEPSLVTLGAAYEKRARLSGSAYAPMLKRADEWLSSPVADAMTERERRGAKVLELDDAVTPLVDALKARGFDSPGLRNVVLSRIARLPPKGQRFEGSFDDVLDRALEKAAAFDPSTLGKDDLAGGAHGGGDEESA